MRRSGAFVALAVSLGLAWGHATLVLGEVTVAPDPPVPGEPFRITLTLSDPSLAPVEDAVVRVELRPHVDAAPAASTGEPPLVEGALTETAPARYEADLVLPSAGAYGVLVRDQTFEWEEATASIVLEIGAGAVGTVPFILPPTAVGPRSLWTWLIWIVGLPIVAGLVVTVLVLTSQRKATDGAA